MDKILLQGLSGQDRKGIPLSSCSCRCLHQSPPVTSVTSSLRDIYQVPDTSPDTTVSLVSCTYLTHLVFIYWSWTVTMMTDWTGGTEQRGAENRGMENWMTGA